MLGQLQSRPISRQYCGEQGEKQRRIHTLSQQLDYLLPRRHRYFCKQYKIDSGLNELPLLLRDMEEYRQLLSAESKKLLAYLHDYQLDGMLNSLIGSIMRYFEEFTSQNARMLSKMARRQQVEVKAEMKDGKCSACSRFLSEYRVQQIRQELRLNHFQDHYNLFNIDHLNFSELSRLQRQSKALIQGDCAQQNQFVYQGGCISLEQYEEVLNLLGSDLHQKNNSIQKIIQYISKTEKRLLGQYKGTDGNGQDELKVFEATVSGDLIKQKLKDMIRLFFKQYIKYKIYRRKNAETQVNFKDVNIISQLQCDKKHLKNRIYTLCTEKERMAMEHENRLKTVNLQLKSNAIQFRQQMQKAAAQTLQMSQKFAEEKHLHEFHKLQLERLTNEYTYLLAVVNRKSVNAKQKEIDSKYSSLAMVNRKSANPKQKERDSKSSRGSKRASSRKSSQDKPKIMMKRQRSSLSVFTHIQSEYQIANDSGKSVKKSKGKNETNKKFLPGEVGKIKNSLNEINKFDSYQKIQEKNEDEENEPMPKPFKETKRKISRFKAFINHFNSNATLQHQPSKKSIEKSNFNANCESLSENPLLSVPPPQEQIACKQLEQSRYEMIYRLFQSERSSQQLTLPFPSFLQLYNEFITKISSQKNLRRSSSIKPRASRLGSNYERASSHTAKYIDEQLVKENIRKVGSKGSQRIRNSSKLQPIEKKSQYFLKKVRKSKGQFDFKNFPRKAEHTQRTEHLVSIKDVQIESSNSNQSNNLYSCFTDEDFNDMFMGQASNIKLQSETSKVQQSLPIQNQVLMKFSAQMAILHIKSPKEYEQVRVVLSHPKEAINRQPITVFKKQAVNELKNSIKNMLRLHRKCKKQKGKTECSHLQRFLRKIRQLSNGHTSLKVVQSEVFQ